MSYSVRYVPPVVSVADEPPVDPQILGWTPQLVAEKLIEAFRIDKRLPRVASPKDPGSAHPQMEYTDEEKEGWEIIIYDPSRAYPSPAEIATMEERFEWLRCVPAKDGISLREWAKCQESGASVRKASRRLKLVHTTLLRRKDRALSLIVTMLCDEGEPVF